MRLSLVFELLLIFVLLAFAASKSIKKQKNNNKTIQNRIDHPKQDENSINKYCKCSESLCNCCRDFNVPLININGPGCASLMYLLGDRMAVSLSYGNRVITNRTLSGRKPSPVCMPLPGGVSKFCGRVYNIGRAGEEFRACLGLELQSKSSVEAAIRVSCFKFGPRGVSSEPADPLPLVPQNDGDDDDDDEDDDDDDDDDDDFGLGDDDDDDTGLIEADNDVEGADYTGFSLLGEDILGDIFGSSGNKKPNKNKKKQAPLPSTTTTTKRPRPSRRPSRRPASATRLTTQRTTTVRVRPSPTRRPNRRPSRRTTTRRPNRKTTVTVTPTSTSGSSVASSPAGASVSDSTTTPPALSVSVSQPQQTTEKTFTLLDDVLLEPVNIMTNKPSTNVQEVLTTPKTSTATNIEDPGLQLSLAHITGQLSDTAITSIIPTSNAATPGYTSKEMLTYEIINTVTPKNTPTVAFSTTSQERVAPQVTDDMIQIVDSLDSESSETENASVGARSEYDSSRSSSDYSDKVNSDYYEGLSLPKKKHKKEKKHKNNDYDDLLGITSITEGISHTLGLDDGKRKHNRQKEKVSDGRKHRDQDYDILGIDAWSETFGITGSKKNNRNGSRRNKMMRGDWST